MELVVRKTDLLRELQLFQGIVERKNTIPILANVLMDAKGSEVRLLATDLEVGLRSRCDATVAKSGALTLPAKKLYEIIKALPETDVRIEEDKGGVHRTEIRYGRFFRSIPLPEGANVEQAKATFENGVLEVSVPVPEEKTRRKQVPIQSGSAAAATSGR